MKKILFVPRFRPSPSGVIIPADVRRPFRWWMTGSFAVVMAALIPLRDTSDAERQNVMRLLRHSRYDVAETVQRIEAAARDRGLPVLAMMPGVRAVLVLASSVGGTPVVMHEADSQPSMPLSVMVRQHSDGGADVLIAAAGVPVADASDWPDLPAAVAEDLQALPSLVERALR